MSAVFAVAHMRAPLGVAALVFLINLSINYLPPDGIRFS